MQQSSNYTAGTRESEIAKLRESPDNYITSAQNSAVGLGKLYSHLYDLTYPDPEKKTKYYTPHNSGFTQAIPFDHFADKYLNFDDSKLMRKNLFGINLKKTIDNTISALDSMPTNNVRKITNLYEKIDSNFSKGLCGYLVGNAKPPINQQRATAEKFNMLKDIKPIERQATPPKSTQMDILHKANEKYLFCNTNPYLYNDNIPEELIINEPGQGLTLETVDHFVGFHTKKILTMNHDMVNSKGFNTDGRVILFCQNPENEKPFFNANRVFTDKDGQKKTILKYIAQYLDVKTDEEIVQYIGSYGFCNRPTNYDNINIRLYYYQALLDKEFSRINNDATLNTNDKKNAQRAQVIKMAQEMFYSTHEKKKKIEINSNGKITRLITDLNHPNDPGSFQIINADSLSAPTGNETQSEDPNFLKVDSYDLSFLTYKLGFNNWNPNYEVLDIDGTFDPSAPASEQNVPNKFIRSDERFTGHPEFFKIQDQQAINNMLDIRGLTCYSVKSLDRIYQLQAGYLLNDTLGQKKKPGGQSEDFYQNNPKDIPFDKHYQDDDQRTSVIIKRQTARVEKGVHELGKQSSRIECLKRLSALYAESNKYSKVRDIRKTIITYLEATDKYEPIFGNALVSSAIDLNETDNQIKKRFVQKLEIDDYQFLKDLIEEIEKLPDTTNEEKQIKRDVKRHFTTACCSGDQHIEVPVLLLLMKHGFITPERLKFETAEIINKTNIGTSYKYFIAVDPDDEKIYKTLQVNEPWIEPIKVPADYPADKLIEYHDNGKPIGNGDEECENYFYQKVMEYLHIQCDMRLADFALKKNKDALTSLLQKEGYAVQSPPWLEPKRTKQSEFEEEEELKKASEEFKARLPSLPTHVGDPKGLVTREEEKNPQKNDEVENTTAYEINPDELLQKSGIIRGVVLMKTLSDEIERLQEATISNAEKNDINTVYNTVDINGDLNDVAVSGNQNANNFWVDSKIVSLKEKLYRILDSIKEKIEDLKSQQNSNGNLKILGKQLLNNVNLVLEHLRTPIYSTAPELKNSNHKHWIKEELYDLKQALFNMKNSYNDFIENFNNYNKLQAKADLQKNILNTKQDQIRQIREKTTDAIKQCETIFKNNDLKNDEKASEMYDDWLTNIIQNRDNLIEAINNFNSENIEDCQEEIQKEFNKLYNKINVFKETLKALAKENEVYVEKLNNIQTKNFFTVSNTNKANKEIKSKLEKEKKKIIRGIENTKKKKNIKAFTKIEPKVKNGLFFDGKQLAISCIGTLSSAAIAGGSFFLKMNPIFFIPAAALFVMTLVTIIYRNFKNNENVNVQNAIQERDILTHSFRSSFKGKEHQQSQENEEEEEELITNNQQDKDDNKKIRKTKELPKKINNNTSEITGIPNNNKVTRNFFLKNTEY